MKFKSKYPRVVCLCGSTKFKDEFIKQNMAESLKGNMVLSVACFTHADGIDLTEDQKIFLDRLHKYKIELADEVFVLNVGGYIGDSCRSEIEHAQKHKKAIRYLESV
jgi:hypothetical protein